MKNLKYLTFLFLVVGSFIYYYKRSSKKSRLRRFIAALRLATIFASVNANLIGNPQSANAVQDSSTHVPEKVRLNQEKFEEVVSSETIHSDKLNERIKNSNKALELRGGTDFPIASPQSFGINYPTFKVDPTARGYKSGAGARGRARGRAAAQNRATKGKSNGLGVSAYATTHQGFCHYHGPNAQSCLTRKVHPLTPFDSPQSPPPSSPPSAPGQGPGKLNSPPPGSEFSGGPSPFKGVFKYDSNFSSSKMNFKDQKSIGHMFDNHSTEALNIPENKNKQSLQKMEYKLVQFMDESDTICLQGSYNYLRPAYLFTKSEEQRSENNLIFAVDAETNHPIIVINATELQFGELDRPDHNLGMDRRPLNPKENCNNEDQSLGSMTLRLRGGPRFLY